MRKLFLVSSVFFLRIERLGYWLRKTTYSKIKKPIVCGVSDLICRVIVEKRKTKIV